MSKENEKVEAAKANLIEQYILLKEKHQHLYFKYQKLVSENNELKMDVIDLKKENEEFKSKSIAETNRSPAEKSLVRENKNLLAKLNQLKRCSSAILTPHQTPVKPAVNKSQEFEVEKLMKHRGRKGKREYFVRWKEFDECDDTWEREDNLFCPEILNKYKKKHKLA